MDSDKSSCWRVVMREDRSRVGSSSSASSRERTQTKPPKNAATFGHTELEPDQTRTIRRCCRPLLRPKPTKRETRIPMTSTRSIILCHFSHSSNSWAPKFFLREESNPEAEEEANAEAEVAKSVDFL
ncbi:uncharacterized protein LOC133875255 [Alnus glutinosa]|uniref:uncharacterized protein LOC133875255 n=1 Tax=Alnus glutinosa TaxID=3517 RepID=UPI002D775A38|nr:uncharacterized protein LOC133875255 [Alnus glutinosa]